MKTLRLLFGIALAAILPLAAQEPADDASVQPLAVVLTSEQLDALLAPIALYPDALIALILPAATVPTDIVLAARYLQENPNDFSQVEHRAWDDSVKSLIHYPDVLRWMDENLPWTKQVGEAFATQPADVMNAIQRLRARARASGALASTPQQQVLTEPEVIRIVPADPEVIYVPRYDPSVVFIDQPFYYSTLPPLLTFGIGCRVGPWLAYDFDWHRRTLWVGDRHRRWHGHHDWRKPVVPIATVPPAHTPGYRPIVRPWQPPPRFRRPLPPPDIGPRLNPPRPSGAGTLANTYGRTSAPPLSVSGPVQTPVTGPRPAPDARPTHRTGRSGSRPENSPTVTTVAPPSQPATATINRRAGEWQRGDRSRTTTATTAAAPVVAPPINMTGPVSTDRPTVRPAPASRMVSTPAATPVVSSPRTLHVRPALSAPTGTVAAPPAPVVRTAPRVEAPPAPAPQAATPAPAPSPPPARGGSGEHRGRARTELP